MSNFYRNENAMELKKIQQKFYKKSNLNITVYCMSSMILGCYYHTRIAEVQ